MSSRNLGGRIDRLESLMPPVPVGPRVVRLEIPDPDCDFHSEEYQRRYGPVRLMTQEEADDLNRRGIPTIFIPEDDDGA
jgi:hypothetical protein